MKKNLGKINVLSPMPIVLVGTEVEGKINYLTIAYVGIIDTNLFSICMEKSHFSYEGIKKNKTLSINFPSENMAKKADYVGMVSGVKQDKSTVFESFYGELRKTPMIKEAPLCMECEVVESIDRDDCEIFLVTPKNVYCDEEAMTDGKVDISKVRPILFDMSTRKYWGIGEAFANAWNVGKELLK